MPGKIDLACFHMRLDKRHEQSCKVLWSYPRHLQMFQILQPETGAGSTVIDGGKSFVIAATCSNFTLFIGGLRTSANCLNFSAYCFMLSLSFTMSESRSSIVH